LDQSDFDWSDPEKMMREAEVLFANALKANPAIRYCRLLRLIATRHFNFLPHAISILNRKISNQSTMHCGAFLPWLLKSTLDWPI
jgi:hypothetical protein